MFGFISRKRLIKEVVRIYKDNDTANANSENNFYFRAGNANALDALCSRLGIDIVASVKGDDFDAHKTPVGMRLDAGIFD